MADEQVTQTPVDWQAVGEGIFAGFLMHFSTGGAQKAVSAAIADGHGASVSAMMNVAEQLAFKVGKAIDTMEAPFLPIIAAFAAPILAGMFGAEIDTSIFHVTGRRIGADVAGRAVVEAMFKSLFEGGSGELTPSMDGAKRVAGAAAGAAIGSSFEAAVPELLSDILPFDLGHFTALTELSGAVIDSLGLGRLVRTALRPAIAVVASTPAEWLMNQKFRPHLLSYYDVARQFARGRMTHDQAFAELALQGYSDARIEALLNSAAKFHSTSDVDLLVRAGQWTADEAIQHLKDQGYEDAIARGEFMIERLKRIASFERSLANYAITAYANRDITRGELIDYVQGNTIDTQEQAQLLEVADARRALNIKHMSLSQVEQCVTAGILSVRDYVSALEREGFPEDEVTALELLLRKKLDEKATLDELRAQQRAERDVAAKAKADAQAAKQQQVADALALERRGREADLRRAAVHGLIPIARYEEVLVPKFDADTVHVMVAMVEDERAAYLAQQQKADDAKKRGAQKGLSVADIEQAVVDGILTMGQYRARLASMGYAPGDVDVLAASLQNKLEDLAAAEARKAALTKDATAKGISLAKDEQLVRAGIRTIGDYRKLLETSGYAPEDVAALVELLQQQLDKDASAQQTHDQVEATAPAKGLSLAQLEAAVVAGVKTVDDYQRALLDAGYVTDAVATLTTLLQGKVDQARAAQQARDQADAATGARELPLSVVQQAARLGIISPDDYAAALEARGFSADDAALQVQVLLTQIAGVQARQAVHDQVAGELAVKGLSLGQFEAAVRASVKSVDDYRAFLITNGYSGDAVDTLVSLLEDKLAQQKDAKKQRDRIAKRLADQGVDLQQLDDAVMSGAATLDDYAGELAQLGVTPAETGILVGLLVQQLTDQAAAPSEGT